ncbi:MAG: NADH-quinone oxidoreductase subunit K [Thiotrichales bacterium]
MTAGLFYALVGGVLFVLGLGGLILRPHLLSKIIAFNVLGSGAFLVLLGLGQRSGVPDPVPQAMVLTGIVVAVAATALALALARRLLDLSGDMLLPGEREADTPAGGDAKEPPHAP